MEFDWQAVLVCRAEGGGGGGEGGGRGFSRLLLRQIQSSSDRAAVRTEDAGGVGPGQSSGGGGKRAIRNAAHAGIRELWWIGLEGACLSTIPLQSLGGATCHSAAGEMHGEWFPTKPLPRIQSGLINLMTEVFPVEMTA